MISRVPSEQIFPAVLESSMEDLELRLEQVSSMVQAVQIDIIDGIFADNLTVAINELAEIDHRGLWFDLQLMTEYPEELLGECYSAGINRVFGHIEKMHDQSEFIEIAEELKILPGLALDLYTPVEAIERDLYPKISGICMMSVKAGFQGQSFSDHVVEKISTLRQFGYRGDIQVDGGMTAETIVACRQAGANQFAVGKTLWHSQDLPKTIKELRQLAQGGIRE